MSEPAFDLSRHIPGQTWRAYAACRGMDPDLFYVEPGGNTDAEARAVCASCPVQEECLDYSLTPYQRFGIWAGLGEKDRRKLRRRRNKAVRSTITAGDGDSRHGTVNGYVNLRCRCGDCSYAKAAAK